MMLKLILDEKIKISSFDSISKLLGYKSLNKAKKAIDKFILNKSCYEWLNSGFYDFTYDSKSFLITLSKVLEVDENLVEKEISEYEEIKKEYKRFKNSYIFVNTNFIKKGESIHVLAMCEGFRRISLSNNNKLLYKSTSEIFDIISNIIVEHYKNNNGKLGVWRDIVNYQLSLFGEKYLFSKEGKYLAKTDSLDNSVAFLKVK